jgi:hypothetical protein
MKPTIRRAFALPFIIEEIFIYLCFLFSFFLLGFAPFSVLGGMPYHCCCCLLLRLFPLYCLLHIMVHAALHYANPTISRAWCCRAPKRNELPPFRVPVAICPLSQTFFVFFCFYRTIARNSPTLGKLRFRVIFIVCRNSLNTQY